MNDAEKSGQLDKQLPLRTIDGWGATLIVAVIAATTFVVQTAKQSEVAALTTQLDGERRRTEVLPDRKSTTVSSESPRDANGAEELSVQIQNLEREKQALVTKLGELSRGALAPDSELGGLIQDLESGDSSKRYAASIGLFELGDARAALPLANYYWRDREEATRSELATHTWRLSSRATPQPGSSSCFAYSKVTICNMLVGHTNS